LAESAPITSSVTHSPRRIHALVALRIMEALRDRDLPPEFLEDEDPSRTMPRRFGLSDVVERQIRSFQADARKGVRLSDEQVSDLFRFVIRRPDSREVFQLVGHTLAGAAVPGRWVGLLPLKVRFAIARSRAKRRLRRLFGRPIGGFARGPFIVEGRSLLFVESDPGGDACHLLSGLSEGLLAQVGVKPWAVAHSLCQGRGDALCRWEVTGIEPRRAT